VRPTAPSGAVGLHIKSDLPCENQITVSEQTTTTRKGHQSVNHLTRSCQGRWKKRRTKYTYDYGSHQRIGMSVTAPNASPWTQSYGYNSLMQLTNVTSPAGSFTYLYWWRSQFASDLVGQLFLPITGDWGNAQVINNFDGLARQTLAELNNEGYSEFQSFQYTYDAGSEVTQQVYAIFNSGIGADANRYLDYSYDNIGQLKTAQGFDGLPGWGSNPARLQEQFGYAYDKAWNLIMRTNNAFLQTNTVNNLNELTRVTQTGTLTVAGTATEPSGNAPVYANPGVTSVTVNTSNAVVYADGTFAATNFTLVVGTNTFTAIAQDNIGRTDTNTVSVFLPANDNMDYDLNGNMLRERSAAGGTNRNFAYDDENQLVSVWVANTWSNSFVYDGLLRKRVEKDYSWTGSTWIETNEIRFLYDGYVVVQERDGNNLPRVTYTRGLDLGGNESPLLGQTVDGFEGAGGIGGLLARTDMGLWVANEPFASAYYFSDAQGNVVALVNTNGAMAAQYEYDPFGNMISMSGLLASANRYRFSSKEWNDGPGLYYYGYRFYDPNLQRWLNRDPIEEDGGVNLYGFVFNAAVNLVDPFGLCDGDHLASMPSYPGLFDKPSQWTSPFTVPSISPYDSSSSQLQSALTTAGKGFLNDTGLGNTLQQYGQNVLNSIPGLGWLGDLLGGSGSNSGFNNPLAGNTGDPSESVNWNVNSYGYAFGQKASVSAGATCTIRGWKIVAGADVSVSPKGLFNLHVKGGPTYGGQISVIPRGW
jgi:RHS repeat-associated protein